MYTQCKRFSGTQVSYIPYGTIGWMRMPVTNEIRQCKCVGAVWKKSEKSYSIRPYYEWKVAQTKEHVFGFYNYGERKLPYATQNDAIIGRCGEHVGQDATFDLFNELQNKYGINTKNIRMHGTWDEHLELKTYQFDKNGSVELCRSDISIVMDKEGIHVSVKDLDDNIGFATQNECVSHTTAKIFTFDEDEEDCNDFSTAKRIVELERIIANARNELNSLI